MCHLCFPCSLPRAGSIPQTLHPTITTIAIAIIRVTLGHWCFSTASNQKHGPSDHCIPRQSALLRLIVSNIFLCPDFGKTHSAPAGGAMRSCLSSCAVVTTTSSFVTRTWKLVFTLFLLVFLTLVCVFPTCPRPWMPVAWPLFLIYCFCFRNTD